MSRWMAILIATALGGGSASANLLVNSGFEQAGQPSLAGWTGGSWQAVELGGQVFARTASAGAATLEQDVASPGGFPQPVLAFACDWGGQAIQLIGAEVYGRNTSQENWTLLWTPFAILGRIQVNSPAWNSFADSTPLPASYAQYNVSLIGQRLTTGSPPPPPDGYAGFDNVSFEVTPEPLSAGLLALGCLAVRRRGR